MKIFARGHGVATSGAWERRLTKTSIILGEKLQGTEGKEEQEGCRPRVSTTRGKERRARKKSTFGEP